jgi:hypothetical protein
MPKIQAKSLSRCIVRVSVGFEASNQWSEEAEAAEEDLQTVLQAVLSLTADRRAGMIDVFAVRHKALRPLTRDKAILSLISRRLSTTMYPTTRTLASMPRTCQGVFRLHPCPFQRKAFP